MISIILLILASISCVLLLLVCFGLFLLLPNFGALLERTSILPLINERSKNIDNYLRILTSEVENSNSPSGTGKIEHMIFTPDGKYSAPTIEELIQKMLADPNSGLNKDNIDELRKFFQNLEDKDEDSDEDTDEEV